KFIKTWVCERIIEGKYRKYSCVEKMFHGDWKKYSNNFGYVSTDDYHQTLQAFSHFTYQYSSTDFFYIKLIRLGGQLIVVDLQGLLDSKSNTFYLTDPAIHTVKNYLEKYG